MESRCGFDSKDLRVRQAWKHSWGAFARCHVARLLPFLIAALGYAQDRPQFVWQGVVDDNVVLHLRGNRLNVQLRQGAPVQRQQYRFNAPVPDTRVDVTLQVLEGRGPVHIVEQPRLENNYTVAVAIEDRQGGGGFYSLALFWPPGDDASAAPPRRARRPAANDGRERLVWSGSVDEEAVIECRRAECIPREVRGRPVVRDRYEFTRSLPDRSVELVLENVNGRGEIRLLEQPSERNNYSARLLIRDPQPGAGDYSFTLAWARPAGEEERLYAERGMLWTGRVDGKVRVVAQGSTSWTEVVAGQPVLNESAQFFRPLPVRNLTNLRLKLLRGRGRAEIIEFPSSRNGYRMAFEIEDPEGGADNYEVEVDW